MGRNLLQRVQASQKDFFDIGQEVGWQKCWDFMTMALRDKEFVGKDTFGPERIKRLYAGIIKYNNHFGHAFLNDTESDVLRDEMDRLLAPLYGENFQRFEERYPDVVHISYKKGKAKWKR